MIPLTGDKLALISAAFARVEKSPLHKWIGDKGLNEIAEAIGGQISVYDLGPRDNKTRFMRVDFDKGSLEFEVCAQPEAHRPENRPDNDPTTPGTPVAMAMAA